MGSTKITGGVDDIYTAYAVVREEGAMSGDPIVIQIFPLFYFRDEDDTVPYEDLLEQAKAKYEDFVFRWYFNDDGMLSRTSGKKTTMEDRVKDYHQWAKDCMEAAVRLNWINVVDHVNMPEPW